MVFDIFSFADRLLASKKRTSRKKKNLKGNQQNSETMESRLLLTSNFNLTPAGNLIVGGSTAANNLTISYDGTLIRFEDTGGPFNVIGGLVGKDVNPAANIVEFDPTTIGVPFNQIVIASSAGNDVVTVNSFRSGAEGLDIRDNGVSDGNDAIFINTDLGTTASRIQQPVALRAETLNLGGSVFTNNKAISLDRGSVNLLTDATIDAGTGNATIFNSTIDGAQSMTVKGALIDFVGTVGGVTPLTGLTASGNVVRMNAVTSNGTVLLEGNTFIPRGAISGTGDLTIQPLAAGTSYTLDVSSLNFIQPGFNSVTIGSSTTTAIALKNNRNNSIATGSLELGSPTRFRAGTITINDSINQAAHTLTFETNALTFAAGSPSTVVGTGDVVIQKLSPAGTLTVNTRNGIGDAVGAYGWGLNNVSINAPGSALVVNKAFGSNVRDLSITAGSFTTAIGTAVNVGGDVTLAVDNLTLSSGVFAAAGSINIVGNVSQAANVVFRVGAGNDLTITGTLTGNGRNVTIRGVGGAIRQVSLGNVTGVALFSIDGADAAESVSVASINAGSIAIVADSIVLRGGTLQTTSGNLSLKGSVVLDGDTQLIGSNLPGRSVRIDGDTDSGAVPASLVIDAGTQGIAVLNGAVGQNAALTNLTITGGGPLTIGTNITVLNDVSLTTNEQGTNQDNIRILSTAAITAGNAVTLTAADRVFIDGTILGALTVVEGGNP
jgi:hypothetical protein